MTFVLARHPTETEPDDGWRVCCFVRVEAIGSRTGAGGVGYTSGGSDGGHRRPQRLAARQ